MGKAAQTLARLIDQRARRRATSIIIARHQDEWDAVYVLEKIKAEDEAESLAQVAAADPSHPSDPSPEPPRLMTGRRQEGQTPLDRIDVARCPHCIKHHDRGHKCARCGAQPPAPSRGVHPDRIRELAAQGHSVARISSMTSTSAITVMKVLENKITRA